MTYHIPIHTLRVALCALVLHFLFWGSNAEAQEDASVELYDYSVEAGDTCVGIAMRELGSRKAYKTIHQHNKLGPSPHRLRPGQILRLPRRKRLPEAKIASAVGKVQFRKATEPSWARAKLGLDLYRAWRVWSQKKANALVTFRDNSSIAMRSDTILVIYGPTESQSHKRIVRADLESGSLRTRLAAREGRLLVNTDSSTIELGGGSSVITSSQGKKRTTLSNHEGKSALVRSRRTGNKKRNKGPSQVAVSPGKGTWLRVGENPAPPVDLPAAPVLKVASTLAIGLAHRGVTIAGSFSPVPRAEKYRVEIAIDPLVRIVISSFELPKGVTSFSALGLPQRDYYLSVAAVDDKGLESIPSKRQRVAAQTIQQTSPDGTLIPVRPSDAKVDSELAQPVVALGSLLTLPEGLQCTVDGNAISDSQLAIQHAGAFQLACIDNENGQSSGFRFDVPQTSIVVSPQSDVRKGIPRNERVTLELQSNAPLPPKDTLRIESSDGLEASIVSVNDRIIRISLLATDLATAASPLKLFQGTAAGNVQLLSLSIDIFKDNTPEPIALKPSDPIFYLAPILGYQSGAFESADGVSAPLVGVRTKLKLGTGISLELDSLLGRQFSSDRTIASNTLFAAYQAKALDAWHLHGRLGVALWHNSEAKPREEQPSNGTRVGAALGVGTSYSLSSGALRLDLTGFLEGSSSRRITSTLSYEFPIQ